MGRWERTHAALREAALQLCGEHGYEATGTASIAKRAGVSEMTLFRHFASKEALLLQDPYDPAIAEAVRARPDDEPPMRALVAGVRSAWQALAVTDVAALRGLLRIVADTPSLTGALERNSTETESALVTALEDRGVATDVARVAAAAVIAGLSRALLDWAQAPGEGHDIHSALDRALTVLGGG